jgi:hypothetical protein
MLAPQRLALLAAFAGTAPAQEISLTLQTLNGQKQFRVGEAIPVLLTFTSRFPSRYLVWTVPTREIMGEEYDRFLIEPAEGTVTFRPRGQNAYNGPGYDADPLGITPITTTLTANDWIAIRQPGHYRVIVETKRALHWLPGGRRGEPVTLRSNAIEIDAVAPEPEWAALVIQHASDLISQITPARSPFGDQEAVRAVRFLGTKEAAHALVRFHLNGPPGVQYEIVKGLMESPYRGEIIEELEAAMADPEAQLSQPRQVRDTLKMLKAR